VKTNSDVKIYFDVSLPESIEIPLAHCSEIDTEEWEEHEYNYRLQICDTKIFAVVNNKVVAHLGIMDATIKAVYVNPEFQGQQITYSLYEAAFQVYPVVYSDDAREPAADRIWKRLMGMYPEKVRYLEKQDQFEYRTEGFDLSEY
jgi:GNAT superfamily N-acetyltransferase